MLFLWRCPRLSCGWTSGGKLAAERNSTLRRVLEYFPQSTQVLSAKYAVSLLVSFPRCRWSEKWFCGSSRSAASGERTRAEQRLVHLAPVHENLAPVAFTGSNSSFNISVMRNIFFICERHAVQGCPARHAREEMDEKQLLVEHVFADQLL